MISLAPPSNTHEPTTVPYPRILQRRSTQLLPPPQQISTIALQSSPHLTSSHLTPQSAYHRDSNSPPSSAAQISATTRPASTVPFEDSIYNTHSHQSMTIRCGPMGWIWVFYHRYVWLGRGGRVEEGGGVGGFIYGWVVRGWFMDYRHFDFLWRGGGRCLF